MHMANEILSPPVAFGTLAIAGGALGFVCAKVKKLVPPDKLVLMGVLGAFIFAAQMVNITLPGMPGTSGHMIGAVLLAIILGPHASALVISSVVMVQCLIFQDGGLLALGCNIINMAIVPAYLGYYIYRLITSGKENVNFVFPAAMTASVIAVLAGAVLVPVEASLSGVLKVPFTTFLVTMLGVHLLVGFVEGIITVAVLGYIQQVKPDIVVDALPGKVRLTQKQLVFSFAILTLVIAGGLSLLASSMPDGLEWSYADRPNQADFEPVIENQNSTIVAADKLQSKLTVMPDYTKRGAGLGQINTEADASSAWTSFAGVVGALLTMGFIYAIARILRKKQTVSA